MNLARHISKVHEERIDDELFSRDLYALMAARLSDDTEITILSEETTYPSGVEGRVFERRSIPLPNINNVKNKQALKPAVTWGLISFGTGTLINLITILLVGQLNPFNVVSIIFCALTGLFCGISVYKIRTR